MKTFDKSRPGIGALGVGLAQGALDISVEYARKRIQFDKPIISFQAVQHKLADGLTLERILDALCDDLAERGALVDPGSRPPERELADLLIDTYEHFHPV